MRQRQRTLRGSALAMVVAVLVAGGAAASSAGQGSRTAAAPQVAATAGPARSVCGAPAPGRVACQSQVRTRPSGAAATTGAPAGYGPADLQAAYRLTAAAASIGGGRTVAIVDAFDDPNAEADLAVYRSQYGLPPCTTANGCFRKVNEQGDAGPLPAPDFGWALEIALDIQMVSATCPQCSILLVEADDNFDDSLGAAVDTAARLGAVAISNSYGGPEFSDESELEPHFNHPGIAVTAASGDGGLGVLIPSAFRNVVSVGGTSLWPTGNPRGWAETAWFDAGSGCSTYIPKPAWEIDKPCTHRTTADVAAVADPYTGVAVYNSFLVTGWFVFGGTSVASPIIASVYALAADAGANPAAFTYAHRNRLFDITSGTNASSCYPTYLCTAGLGYDGPTGLGTPNGTAAF